MRTVSLLPAASEIVAALGMIDHLVGVSHECDYPDQVEDKPRVTACAIASKVLPSQEIDACVRDRLSRGESLYTIDEPTLRALQPELILTQKLCDVCAPAYGSVVALAQSLPGPPRVLNLEPSSLADILDNIQMVADALGVPAAGVQLTQRLRQRIDRVARQAAIASHRPRLAVLEWLDPVYCSGHWTPELVQLAGGQEVLGLPGRDSRRITWHDVANSAAEFLILACCGQSASRAIQDWEQLVKRPELHDLTPVRAGQVYVVDGNAYFSRPGPRVVDTLEILAEIVHPELFAGDFPDRGVQRVAFASTLFV